MNSFERYMRMVRGEKVDFLPRIPVLMHFAVRHINATYDNFARDYKVLVKANRSLVEDFGIDQLDIMSDPWRETSAFGGKIRYGKDTIPFCTHPLENNKSLSVLKKPDVYKSPRMLNALNAIKSFKEFGWHKYSITGWVEGPAAEMADLRGVTNFMMDLYDDKPYTCDLMDICTKTAIRFARAQISYGADTIGIGDAIVSQVSPDIYEKVIFSYEKKLVDAIHKAGGLARLHICGNINNHLPAIAELGIDIIDCDSAVDMEKARSILGSNIVLTGNLDPVNSVMKSNPGKIGNDISEIYKKVGNPYFVNAGCEIPADTPAENLEALCEPIPAK
jgi:MtaA/CmuA family methyltransferase